MPTHAPLAPSLANPASASPASWLNALLQHWPAPPEPLAALQRQAQAGLRQSAWPSRRQEAWRFTDPALITAIAPQPLLAPSLPLPPAAAGVLRLRLDGAADPLAGVTLPQGLEPLPAAELAQRLGTVLTATGSPQDWPVLLNGALAERVLALRVRGAVAPTLELVSDAGTAEGLLPLRLLLVLEENASLELLQVHRAAGASLTSVVLEADLGPGARLRHGLLASGHDEAVLLAHLALRQAPGSDAALAAASAGWGLSRLEPQVLQADGSAHTRLRGLQVVQGRQIADTHSLVHFLGPEGRLDQQHRAVADGAGRSVFNGAVRVPRLAQRTDAAQLSRNLLLSDRARIDTKPELEIVADDVKCAHGATVSRLQQDELFYLQSRGIGAGQAARLLLQGFCQEVLADLPAAAQVWDPLTILQIAPPTEVPAP